VVACVHGDTSTTMAQPLDGLGALCRAAGALSYVDATATIGGMEIAVDRWGVDVVTGGLQKCLGGPSGSSPITISEARGRTHLLPPPCRAGASTGPSPAKISGPRIGSNYFDLAMVMDYWSDKRLNHHTEATTMLYGARECARVALGEGWRRVSRAMRRPGRASGRRGARDGADRLRRRSLPHDQRHRRCTSQAGVDGEAVRRRMREDFEIEIGTAFGPLAGKVWRIGAMGYNAMKHKVLITLGALEAVPAGGRPDLPARRRGRAALAAWG
jgi:(S)-ureidoglycine-glyoxylate aminotransferase